MKALYKLKEYKDTLKFEKEHPKLLQWDLTYKLYMLEQNDECQGIWLKDENEIVGEIILSWQSANVLYIESFTVLPNHQGKGLGHELVKLAIEWGINSDFKFITGEARKAASWKVFENFGATPILVYEDWAGTKEDYISFKLEI